MIEAVTKVFVFSALLLTTALWTPTVSAQDDDLLCSGDDVADALDGLECAADGVYLSPEVAADELSYRCADAETEKGCRTCFNRARAKLQIAFRALSKAGFLDRSAVRRLKTTFARMREETCSAIDEDQPIAEEPEDPTNSNPGETEPPHELPPEHTPLPEYTPWNPEPPFSEPAPTPPPMPTFNPEQSEPPFPEPELTPPPIPTSDPEGADED